MLCMLMSAMRAGPGGGQRHQFSSAVCFSLRRSCSSAVLHAMGGGGEGGGGEGGGRRRGGGGMSAWEQCLKLWWRL